MRFHLLSPGFTSPNGRAFLFPLIRWRRALRDAGIEWRLFDTVTAALVNCDILGVDSRYYSPRWRNETAAILDELASLKQKVGRLIWFDTTDSTGIDQFLPLQIADTWVKNQLAIDRNQYRHPIYAGGRIWCDHYHRHQGVEDTEPLWSEPPTAPDDLRKLRVGWNSGLADYSLIGPFRMAAYQHLKWPGLLDFQGQVVSPGQPRDNAVSARFGTSYARASVAWQRQQMAAKLSGRMSTEKLRRLGYLRELGRSKLVLSPFGLGEITLKDFEVFRAGALLVKPDMSHLETWPDLFRDGQAMISHTWELDDLPDLLEQLLSDPERCRAIAEAGQATYLRHTESKEAPNLFTGHLLGLLK
jgi:hypothetical protein